MRAWRIVFGKAGRMRNPRHQKDRDLDAGLTMTVNISRWDNVAAFRCSKCLLAGGEQAEDGSGLGSGSKGSRPDRNARTLP